VEANYARLGTVKYIGYGDADFDQFALSAIGSLPLNDHFSLYARVGYNNLHASGSGYLPESVSDNGVLAGLGVSYAFNKHLSGRVEFQRPASDITTTRVGVFYSF
jgi:opacity protein-like surface antigen